MGVVPASVIHQRLVDEEGLEASVASLRRYLRAHFAEEVRRGEVVVWRPPVDPGDEAQVDYGYLGTWFDPASGRRRRVWAFSMVLATRGTCSCYPVLQHGPAGVGRRPCGRVRLLRVLPQPGWCSTTFAPG